MLQAIFVTLGTSILATEGVCRMLTAHATTVWAAASQRLGGTWQVMLTNAICTTAVRMHQHSVLAQQTCSHAPAHLHTAAPWRRIPRLITVCQTL